ncbi:helix-turn-helix transcriptional regulator, partial [Hymenobacter coccineus]|uniref:helix-turn-helix transcriptional regulator n=1 Tax=Hymenobacter coccineus TaxID=1908235 RepID=UPI000A55E60A
MVDRIRELLLARQLSPTQFADAIGVARPIMSHILSGRNKPSLEVVQKIRAAFPDLSIDWLLDGTGPMLVLAAPILPGASSDPPPRRQAPMLPLGPQSRHMLAQRLPPRPFQRAPGPLRRAARLPL